MENTYQYFKRDLSWLSFNYRVLLEAEDDTLPVYERIKFLSIYSSNLEEFYEIRVAEHRAVIMRKNYADESAEEAEETLAAITREVNRQQREYYRVFSEMILPELNRQHIYLYPNERPEPFHEAFVREYFNEEVFPFLAPVMIQAGDIRTFIRDRRLYLVIRMRKRRKRPDDAAGERPPYSYALMKIPYSKVPRFIELPPRDGKYYIMFVDDIIRANLPSVFPGYEIDSCYSIKISRDADIYIGDESRGNLVENIRKNVQRRKIGALSRFMYDRAMPDDFLAFLCDAFGIRTDDLVQGGRYHNLQDLSKLPNPVGDRLEWHPPVPMRVPFLDEMGSVFKAVKRRDVLLHFPYESFDYLIRFLMEAAFDPKVDEIKITGALRRGEQYAHGGADGASGHPYYLQYPRIEGAREGGRDLAERRLGWEQATGFRLPEHRQLQREDRQDLFGYGVADLERRDYHGYQQGVRRLGGTFEGADIPASVGGTV